MQGVWNGVFCCCGRLHPPEKVSEPEIPRIRAQKKTPPVGSAFDVICISFGSVRSVNLALPGFREGLRPDLPYKNKHVVPLWKAR